jgi:hypothetical protein
MTGKINRSIQIIAAVSGLFGLLTIVSGGSVLLFTGTFQEQVGNFVPFVVWFNFLMGFFYIIAGYGLWIRKKWAIWVSIFIASTSLVTLGLLGLHGFKGGIYEIRTVFAMIFRIVVWTIISIFAYRQIIHKTSSD